MPEDFIVPYDELHTADLHVDRIYAGKTFNGRSLDPVSRIFGVGVQGGIRFRGSALNNSVSLAVLYSTGDNPDWRDYLDTQTGILTYYGDNRYPGRELLDTHLRGNVAVKNAFEDARGSEDRRRRVSPFFYFETVRKKGSLVRFRGLAVPGVESLKSSEELAALWSSKNGQRFQNYCARFTILDAPVISRSWIDALIAGDPRFGDDCPDAWRLWVESRTYRALVAPSTTNVRKKEQQLPSDALGLEILAEIRQYFTSRNDFQKCAMAVWKLMSPATKIPGRGDKELDTGSFSGGEYLIGPAADQVSIGFVLAADSGVTGKPVVDVSLLLSRLRFREFGVFVTLSYFADQVYDEVRADRHPVALVCGKDVVEILRRQGYSDSVSVREWLAQEFPGDGRGA
ncbi:hypothetical protein [Nocardia sp. BMG51109]|uniref:hypothetical protein n=1 Tax=Nocardia sp. BMG51109 TaxID=1056816 RepID=UPI0004B12C86|nr:hypothetical protein [Nocardia sp. BMG51109]